VSAAGIGGNGVEALFPLAGQGPEGWFGVFVDRARLRLSSDSIDRPQLLADLLPQPEVLRIRTTSLIGLLLAVGYREAGD